MLWWIIFGAGMIWVCGGNAQWEDAVSRRMFQRAQELIDSVMEVLVGLDSAALNKVFNRNQAVSIGHVQELQDSVIWWDSGRAIGIYKTGRVLPAGVVVLYRRGVIRGWIIELTDWERVLLNWQWFWDEDRLSPYQCDRMMQVIAMSRWAGWWEVHVFRRKVGIVGKRCEDGQQVRAEQSSKARGDTECYRYYVVDDVKQDVYSVQICRRGKKLGIRWDKEAGLGQ